MKAAEKLNGLEETAYFRCVADVLSRLILQRNGALIPTAGRRTREGPLCKQRVNLHAQHRRARPKQRINELAARNHTFRPVSVALQTARADAGAWAFSAASVSQRSSGSGIPSCSRTARTRASGSPGTSMQQVSPTSGGTARNRSRSSQVSSE